MKYQKNGIKRMLNQAVIARILHERNLLSQNYDKKFVQSTVQYTNDGPRLICHVYYSLLGEDIHFRIIYDGMSSPKAWVVSPEIENPQHIYSDDKRLCLYDPDTDEWTNDKNIYNTFVPWCQQWIVFQRLFEQTGKWMHPERHPTVGDDKG